MVVIFTKDNCAGCSQLKEYLGDRLNNAKVKVMNVSEHPDLIDKYNIKGLPTTVRFDSTFSEQARTVGFSEEKQGRVEKILKDIA